MFRLVKALYFWLLARLPKAERVALIEGSRPKIETVRPDPIELPSTTEAFNAILQKRLADFERKREEIAGERGYIIRPVVGLAPDDAGVPLSLSDRGVIGARVEYGDPILVETRAEAERLEQQSREALRELVDSAVGPVAQTDELPPIMLADAPAWAPPEYMTSDPGNSGVGYEDGLPVSQEHNGRFRPIIGRGLQFNHGTFHKVLLESGTFRRAWKDIVNVLYLGVWSVDSAADRVDPDDPNAEQLRQRAEDQAKFVQNVLLENLWGGWLKFIREAMYSVVAGFAAFVEVWHRPSSPHWGAIKKLSFRWPSSLRRWIVDEETLELLAAEFVDYKGEKTLIPANQMLLYSYDALGDDYEGTSATRSIVVWVEILQLFSELEAISGEKRGVAWTYARPGRDDTESHEELKGIINAAIAAENPIITLPGGAEIEVSSPAGEVPSFDTQKRFALERVTEILNSEGSLIGLGVTGAYAARESADSSAKGVAPAYARLICDGLNGANNVPWTGPIKKMVDLRFGGPPIPGAYPKIGFKLNDYENPDRFDKLVAGVEKGLIQKTPEVQREAHRILDVPFVEQAEEEVEQDEEPDAQLGDYDKAPVLSLADFDAEDAERILDKADAKLGAALRKVAREHRAWWRDRLDAARRSNNFSATVINETAEQARRRFLPMYEAAVAETMADVARLGGSAAFAETAGKKVKDFQLPRTIGSQTALQVKIRSISQEAFNRQDGLIVDRFAQFARGEKSIGLPVLAESTMASIANKATSTAFNAGRDIVVSEVKERARAAGLPDRVIAERTSVLDANTCDECERLNGVRAVVGTQKYADLSPPNKCLGGDRCRCIWVFITPDEEGFDEIYEGLL